MANIINTLLIKRSQNNYASTSRFDCTLQNETEYATYFIENIPSYSYSHTCKKTSLKCIDAARYCVDNCKLYSNEPTPFYALMFFENKREIVNVAVGTDLTAYLQKGTQERNSKEYYNAVSCVMKNIKNAEKNKIIVAYTLDKAKAEYYATFKLSYELPAEELQRIWKRCVTPKERSFVMDKLLDKHRNKFSSVIIGTLMSNADIFRTFYWEIVKYVMLKNQTLNERVFALMLQSASVTGILENTKTLNGLDFSNETQFAIIQRAISAGIDCKEFQTQDGWLSVEKMINKAKVNAII